MKSLLVLVLVGGCASGLQRANTGGLIGAEAAIGCDAGQTFYAAHADYDERNPIIGRRPSDLMITSYMATAMIGTAALWFVLPERWRPASWGAVGALETESVVHNAVQDVPICGL